MSVPSSHNQSHLMKRIIERDETALSEMYSAYGAQVYGVALYILNNSVLAEEATQDTFFKVWNSARRWDENKGKISTWVLTIARFTAIDILRREKRHFHDSGTSIDDIPLQTAGLRWDSSWHDSELLKSLISQLPEEQIQAIELAFFKDMTHQEIADHLSQPLGTVKSRIRNGLQSLRGLWLMETR